MRCVDTFFEPSIICKEILRVAPFRSKQTRYEIEILLKFIVKKKYIKLFDNARLFVYFNQRFIYKSKLMYPCELNILKYLNKS